eukprot:g35764.t1
MAAPGSGSNICQNEAPAPSAWGGPTADSEPCFGPSSFSGGCVAETDPVRTLGIDDVGGGEMAVPGAVLQLQAMAGPRYPPAVVVLFQLQL